MLGFVQNIFAPLLSTKCNPIGVDYGSDCLRLAQVQRMDNGEIKLIAAASADVPSHVRHDAAARVEFFVESCKELLTSGGFKGRQAIIGLPAASMFIHHLRMPKLDADAMKKALPWELRGKLPIDPSHAQLRHIIAGEIYEGQEPKSEVIVIAAAKEMINVLLAAASRAKLDVVGMNVEPKALVDCFSQLYRRKSDEGVTNCYVDIGCVASRAVVARGSDILFARTIAVGGDHFSRATANALRIKLDDAKMLRAQIAQAQSAAIDEAKKEQSAEPAPAPKIDASIENSFALLPPGVMNDRRQSDLVAAPEPVPVASVPGLDPELAAKANKVTDACSELVARLTSELELCRRYYEMTFPEKPLQRLIFIGGEARQKQLCQHIAKKMGLAAQIGDPMARINRNGDVGADAGLEKGKPAPSWGVAVGLSLGPAGGEGAKVKAEAKVAAEN